MRGRRSTKRRSSGNNPERRLSLTGYVLKHALTATASVAPLLGALLTVFRILGAFKGCPCGASAEDRVAFIAEILADALLPFVYGLAIGILAKLAHGDPAARIPPMGAGFDIAARELADALTRQRFKIPTLHRGALDSFLVVSTAAYLLAALLLLDTITFPYIDGWFFLAANLNNGNIAALGAALVVAMSTRLAHRYLETQHQTLQAEMDSLARDLANALRH